VFALGWFIAAGAASALLMGCIAIVEGRSLTRVALYYLIAIAAAGTSAVTQQAGDELRRS
jgi:hypothetical protein